MTQRAVAREAELAEDTRLRYAGASASVLGPVTAIVSLLYALLALAHLMVLGGDTGRTMSLVAAATALGVGAVSVIWYRLHVRLQFANFLLASVLVVAFGNSGLHMHLTGQAMQTTNFMLVIIACGLGLLATGWNVAVTLVGWAVWLAAASQLPDEDLTHWIFSMLMATFVGQLARFSRRRSLDTAAHAYGRIEELSLRDPLTGLANRRGLVVRGTELLSIARQTGSDAHATFIDVDGLKEVNDTHGHDAGDAVLIAVAEGLNAAFAESDVIARWGGDEFAVVSLGASPARTDLEARIRRAVSDATTVSTTVWPGQISIGLVRLTDHTGDDLENLLLRADQDMYETRRRKRD